MQRIIRIAAGNGVGEVVVGANGLLSTPAVSALIRSINAAKPDSCVGGILLTASHNPGGEHNDFGIKFNTANGGPALETLTDAIFAHTKSIESFKQVALPNDVDVSKAPAVFSFGAGAFTVRVVNPVEVYTDLMQKLFDFDALKVLFAREDFSFVYDSMSGIAGPYARRIFGELLGVSEENLMNCDPSPDFNGGHPDPNLTYAENLVKVMGLGKEVPEKVPDFGAAADGDADRNMILGKRFFVTPSDSIAIIAANYKSIPYMRNGIHGVARSMPTS